MWMLSCSFHLSSAQDIANSLHTDQPQEKKNSYESILFFSISRWYLLGIEEGEHVRDAFSTGRLD